MKKEKNEPEFKNESQEKKKITRLKRKKTPTKAFEDSEKEYNKRRIKYTIEIFTIVLFSIIMLFLLCNRTFFREEYKTSKIKINIPLLMFFEKDTGNEITLKTLRKSQYLKDYFDDELSKMTRYNCDGYSFYYNDETSTAIYSIDVDKEFAMKTITIKYAKGNADCLCEIKAVGKNAEDICK